MDKHVEAEIQRIIAAVSDLKIEFNLPADAEVRFVGPPNLALNSATHNLTAPAKFLHHPLVQDRYFCTLPRYLWDELYNRVGPERFASERVELEDVLSGICGDHTSHAGFRNGRAFAFRLRHRPVQLPLGKALSLGIASNKAASERASQIADERIGAMTKVTHAYSGWIMTNPLFLGELDALLETWNVMVRRWGFERLAILLPKGTFLPGDDPTADQHWPTYHAAFKEFSIRWRLKGLAAPYLPVPLQPLMSGQFPVSILPQIASAGGLFFVPDTFPIPSRDSLRDMLEDSLRGSAKTDHLKEWMALIANDNAAKKPLVRFARLFEVQHFYRLLQQRHEVALRGKLTTVKSVLAKYLGVADRTIGEDITFIKKQLGPEWVNRGAESGL